MRKTMILLTIDAWRADFADSFEGVCLVPALAARPAARMARLWANGPWTTPALVAVLTGGHALRHDVHYRWSQPRHDAVGLATVFREHRFHVPTLCSMASHDNYRHLGFVPDAAPALPTSADDPVLFEAIGRAALEREPSFLWYHYRFVHMPYWAEDQFRRVVGVESVPDRLRQAVGVRGDAPRGRVTLAEDDAPVLRRMYAAGVLGMNAWLERVLERIRSVGLDATVVITADHGDELLEHGHVGHASTARDGRLFDEILRIPCYVLDSRITESRVVTERAEGRDLFATILGLAGLPAPASSGVNFSAALLRGTPTGADPQRVFCAHTSAWGFATPPERMWQCRTALLDDRWKYVSAPGDECLYDLVNDPGEREPIRDESRLLAWRSRLERERLQAP
jgi:choline-sulfatase